MQFEPVKVQRTTRTCRQSLVLPTTPEKNPITCYPATNPLPLALTLGQIYQPQRVSPTGMSAGAPECPPPYPDGEKDKVIRRKTDGDYNAMGHRAQHPSLRYLWRRRGKSGSPGGQGKSCRGN